MSSFAHSLLAMGEFVCSFIHLASIYLEREINMKKNNSILTLDYMAKIGILSALAIVIMLFSFPVWFAPPFYKLDFSEVAVLIGGFAMGPLAAVFIEFIKILLNVLFNGSETMGIGELANFIMGLSFVLPAVYLYRRKKSLKLAILGMALGTLSLCIVGGLLNLFVMLPVYSVVYGMPLDALVAMGSKLNGAINGLTTFVIFATTPFNLLKGLAVSVITVLLYKHISPILHKQSFSTKR